MCLDVNGENMIYKVKARVIEERIGEFYRNAEGRTILLVDKRRRCMRRRWGAGLSGP
jgi:hypothetical protein